MSSVITAYYSRAGENYVNGEIKNIEIGNTERLVEMIERYIHTVAFKIEMKTPYSSNYKEALAQAEKDFKEDARPKLSAYLFDLEGYDTVILCYPSYYGTVPMAVKSFCEEIDWAGKYILPICTNEGSGMGNSVADLKKVCEGATISSGLSVIGSKVEESREEVENWLFMHGVK